ncbi:hypothetical protein [Cryobacterium roopkundense]|uniref:Putative membrane protein YeaQ/YmgE (Transglycosylase-associated protein family) n=1 Tax=Cryobacterium roopkundense TaxID=1001240 RepID=A0A7W9E530_9MICO|nr:hypothetical protein [Cryobacterium roopkundense]MBB5643327.1 putative membrane protein YeaQ/YmgE (transglycosylase-associated protein family) [Cryobacterium roopkundense]
MSSTTVTSAQSADLAVFDRTTSRWGRLTMIAALIMSLAAPLYLVLFADLGITQVQVWTAFFAVAAVFSVLWVVEPITYYPILGPATMYQAFMIGNIANKLLPSALVAQASIGAKAGTKRGEFSALMAICGAAMVHVFFMLVFVGVLGSWLVSIVPADVTDVARLYIFPSIIGAVVVQLVVSLKQARITFIAIATAAVVFFVIIPAVPAVANLATGITVVATAILAWFLRKKSQPESTKETS